MRKTIKVTDKAHRIILAESKRRKRIRHPYSTMEDVASEYIVNANEQVKKDECGND